MKNPVLFALATIALLSSGLPAKADWENGRHMGWYNHNVNIIRTDRSDRDNWRFRHSISNNGYWNNGWRNNNLNYWQQQRLLRRSELGSRWRNRWY